MSNGYDNFQCYGEDKIMVSKLSFYISLVKDQSVCI